MNCIEEHFEIAKDKLNASRAPLENDMYADSVSRSYYGMFNAAKALLLTEDSSPKTLSGVATELGKLFRDRIDRELLSDLSRLQELREKSDYTNYQPTENEAEEVLQTAEEFVSKSKSLTP